MADLKRSLTAFIDSSIFPGGRPAIKAPDAPSRLAKDIIKNEKFLRKAEPGFWKDIVSNGAGVVSANRVDALRAIMMKGVGEFEYKPREAMIILSLMKKCSVDGVELLSCPQDKLSREQWRRWLANLSNNVSQGYVNDSQLAARFGLEGEDIVGFWREVALMWNKKNPVVLHTPVGSMAQSGTWLARHGCLDVEHLAGLWPEFISVMEKRARGEGIRESLIDRGADPEAAVSILSLLKKKHITELAGKHRTEADQPTYERRMKM